MFSSGLVFTFGDFIVKTVPSWVWFVIVLLLVAIVTAAIVTKVFHSRFPKTDSRPSTELNLSYRRYSNRSNTNVGSLLFLTQPSDCEYGAGFLPDIEIRAFDHDDHYLTDIRICLSLQSNTRHAKLRGNTKRLTNAEGVAVFKHLQISQLGTYHLTAKANGVSASSAEFTVMPPGLDTNFSDKDFGSAEYLESLVKKLVMAPGDDYLEINGEVYDS